MSQPNAPRALSLRERLQALRARIAVSPRESTPRRVTLNLETVEDRTVPSTVSGSVWTDANNNAIRDAGEAGVGGASVTLSGMGGPQTTSTDANGDFAFLGVASGSYSVSVSGPGVTDYNQSRFIMVGTDDVSVGFGIGGGFGSTSGSGSAYTDHYPEYVAEVNNAAAQYQSSASSAYSQYLAAANAVNDAAQSQADNAYQGYYSTAYNAYLAYNSQYSQLYNTLQQALDGANAALTSAIAASESTFMATVNSASAAADAAWSAAKTTFDNALDTATTQYEAAAEAAWAEGDIDALDAAYNTYLDAVAAAATAFNTANQSGMDSAQSAITAAESAQTAAIYDAEAVWTTTMEAAQAAFDQANDSAWNQYLITESSAWNQYLSALGSIASQQQADLDAAWNQFQSDLSAAAATFSGAEAAAWATYQGTLQPGQPVGARLDAVPMFAGAPVMAAPLLVGMQMVQNNQGQPPPINWNRGAVVRQNYAPWGANPPATGTVYEIEIGRDAANRPIMVRYWQAAAPWRVEWHYWCHGLTFNGGGPMSFSPFSGGDVQRILDRFYRAIGAGAAQAGDILVFSAQGQPNNHSCIIVTPVLLPGGGLDPDRTIVNTKNGPNAQQQNATLASVIAIYGGNYTIYTRR